MATTQKHFDCTCVDMPFRISSKNKFVRSVHSAMNVLPPNVFFFSSIRVIILSGKKPSKTVLSTLFSPDVYDVFVFMYSLSLFR